jgi:hypothetical protein
MALDLVSLPIMFFPICLSVAGNPASCACRRRPRIHCGYRVIIVRRLRHLEGAAVASLLILSHPRVVMRQNTMQTVNELIAGSFGGAAQVLVGQPLDTIKTRAQIAPSSVSLHYAIGSQPHQA